MQQNENIWTEGTSNYKDVIERWKSDFTTWNHEAICKKLSINDYDEERIRLNYFGIPHYVDRKTGEIGCVGTEGYQAGFDEIMAIFSLFYYCEEHAKNSGEWVPLRDVKSTGVFEKAFGNQILKPFADAFRGKAEEFNRIGNECGFTSLNYGDGAFEISVFDNISIRVIFWDADEEFPASVNILFDKNIIQFIHPESVVMLGSECQRIFMEHLQ